MKQNQEQKVGKATVRQKEIVIRVNPDYIPVDGDAFDAIQSALDHFEIPATLFERETDITPRIVIGLEGGLIQGATSNIPIEYLVYDYDIEGACDDEVATRPAINGGEVEVFKAGIRDTEINSGKVAEIFGAVISELSEEHVKPKIKPKGTSLGM